MKLNSFTTIIISGHTGWTDDFEYAFKKKDKVIGLFTKVLDDPQAPYDAYDESDDTKENTLKQIPIPKKITYKDL